jgi:hypothetical protein
MYGDTFAKSPFSLQKIKIAQQKESKLGNRTIWLYSEYVDGILFFMFNYLNLLWTFLIFFAPIYACQDLKCAAWICHCGRGLNCKRRDGSKKSFHNHTASNFKGLWQMRRRDFLSVVKRPWHARIVSASHRSQGNQSAARRKVAIRRGRRARHFAVKLLSKTFSPRQKVWLYTRGARVLAQNVWRKK